MRRIAFTQLRPYSVYAHMDRTGSISILTAVMLVILLGLVAFALDTGMLMVARTELQRTADASALASCGELLHQRASGNTNYASVRTTAADFALNNQVRLAGPQIELNPDNQPTGDIVLGEMIDSAKPAELSYSLPARFNTTRVKISRTVDRNGEIPLFFARIWGLESGAVLAEAQASFIDSFQGFRMPSPGDGSTGNLMFLPVTVDVNAWEAALKGAGTDQYGWNEDKQQVFAGADGSTEINLFPVDTGGSGNWGLVDIGSNNVGNGTIARQIRSGLTAADLDFHGGQLSLNGAGELTLSGNTGISVGAMQAAMKSAIGQPRIIPLYSKIAGSGQNAEYTIVKFAGGRIMAVKLTGGNKYLRVQPGPIITRGGIPADDGQNRSTQVFSPVHLTR